MKRFRFSLQAVRVLREREERSAREYFAHTVRARQNASTALETSERELDAGRRELLALQTNGANIAAIRAALAHCGEREQQLLQRRNTLALAEKQAADAWDKLLDARRQLDVVDKFHDRRREEHDRELRREEQKQLDEMSGRALRESGDGRTANMSASALN